MKIAPIDTTNVIPKLNQRKINFKGYFVRDTWNGSTHLNAARATGKREEIVSDKIIDKYSNNRIIYYADPLEVVPEHVRNNVNHIFYDDEPKIFNIEEVKEYYFSKVNSTGLASRPDISEHNYIKQLNNYKEYFYRLEMAEKKAAEGYAKRANTDLNAKEKMEYHYNHVKDAQYNQKIADNYIKIFEKHLPFIKTKDAQLSRTHAIKNEIDKIENDYIEKSNLMLEQRTELKEFLEKKISDIETREEFFNNAKVMLKASDYEKRDFNELIEKNDTSSIFFHLIFNDSTKQRDIQEGVVIANYGEKFVVNPDRDMDFKETKEAIANESKYNPKELDLIDQIETPFATLKQNYKTLLERNNDKIAVLQKLLNFTHKNLEMLKKQLVKETNIVEKVKLEMRPHYNELKTYVQANPLRIVR